eukprot:COSAG01_NODE_5030_length_4536_cov_15.098715_2_plen_1085_part_00
MTHRPTTNGIVVLLASVALRAQLSSSIVATAPTSSVDDYLTGGASDHASRVSNASAETHKNTTWDEHQPQPQCDSCSFKCAMYPGKGGCKGSNGQGTGQCCSCPGSCGPVGCCPPKPSPPPPPAPSHKLLDAILTITREGMNNAPELYGDMLTEAVKAANAAMRHPNFWCWAMGKANLFVSYSDVQVLDANMTFDVEWTQPNRPPTMRVLATDRLAFTWSNGSVEVLCKDNDADMLYMLWSVLTGKGTFNSTVSRSTTCAFPQVSSFDMHQAQMQLVAPKLPLPNTFVSSLMKSALSSGRPQINNVLEVNEFCIPTDVSQYLRPPPTVHLYPLIQYPGQGFVEYASFCGPAHFGAKVACAQATTLEAKSNTAVKPSCLLKTGLSTSSTTTFAAASQSGLSVVQRILDNSRKFGLTEQEKRTWPDESAQIGIRTVSTLSQSENPGVVAGSVIQCQGSCPAPPPSAPERCKVKPGVDPVYGVLCDRTKTAAGCRLLNETCMWEGGGAAVPPPPPSRYRAVTFFDCMYDDVGNTPAKNASVLSTEKLCDSLGDACIGFNFPDLKLKSGCHQWTDCKLGTGCHTNRGHGRNPTIFYFKPGHDVSNKQRPFCVQNTNTGDYYIKTGGNVLKTEGWDGGKSDKCCRADIDTCRWFSTINLCSQALSQLKCHCYACGSSTPDTSLSTCKPPDDDCSSNVNKHPANNGCYSTAPIGGCADCECATGVCVGKSNHSLKAEQGAMGCLPCTSSNGPTASIGCPTLWTHEPVPALCQSTPFFNGDCNNGELLECVNGQFVSSQFNSSQCAGVATSVVNYANGTCIQQGDPKSADVVSITVVCPRPKKLSPNRRHSAAMMTAVITTLICAIVAAIAAAYFRQQLGSACGRIAQMVQVRTTRIVAVVYEQCAEYSATLYASVWVPIRAHASTVAAWLWQQYIQPLGVFIYQCLMHCVNAAIAVCNFVRSMTFHGVLKGRDCDRLHGCCLLAALVTAAIHGQMWSRHDPFARFDRNILGQLGVGGQYIDAQHVQQSFALWSHYGQTLQRYGCVVLLFATLLEPWQRCISRAILAMSKSAEVWLCTRKERPASSLIRWS